MMQTVPPRHRPYRTAAAAFQIGLSPMDMGTWLDIGPGHADFMAEKRGRLRNRPPVHYAAIPESLAAQREVLNIVADNLAAHRPEAFARDGRHLTDLVDGTVHDLEAPGEPLDLLGAITEEDFILLDHPEGENRLLAASNAYTTSGRIVGSVGHSMRFAHEFVPGLNEQLGARIDRVLANIRVDHPVYRYNWGLTAIASRLFPVSAHEATAEAARETASRLTTNPERAGDLLWLRVERQTFVRLPQTGVLAFAIHTYSDPLSAIADDRESLAALQRLLAEYSDDRLRYSAMLEIRDPVLRWIGLRQEG